MRRTRHALAEERSLALHAEIAARMREDRVVLERARERVEDWIRGGGAPLVYARRWRRLLGGSIDDVARAIVDRGEDACALRQVTPFAGTVPPQTRWRIWREVRERWEAA